MGITDDERRTLLAEADLLDRVAFLATVPGRLDPGELDEALRAVEVPEAGAGGRHARRVLRVPGPRHRSEA